MADTVTDVVDIGIINQVPASPVVRVISLEVRQDGAINVTYHPETCTVYEIVGILTALLKRLAG